MLKQACAIRLIAATARAQQLSQPFTTPIWTESSPTHRNLSYVLALAARDRGRGADCRKAGGPSGSRTQLFAFGGSFDWRLDGYPISGIQKSTRPRRLSAALSP